MPGIFSRVRPSLRLSRPKNTPVSGDHARHPLDSPTSGPLRLAYQNVDPIDHPIDSIKRDFNEVIKRLLGEGVAFNAISVGSYAHRYRWY
jgi:hypothetical protein